jgi:hypothetical protein
MTQADLAPVLAEAIKRRQTAGLIEAQVVKLREVEVVIEDIGGAYLGATALHDTDVRLTSPPASAGLPRVPRSTSSWRPAGALAGKRKFRAC